MGTRLVVALSLLTALTASGCNASRDVRVAGTIDEDTTEGASGPIRVSFYEVVGSADGGAGAPDLELVDTETMARAGPFEASLSMKGDRLYVVAVLDADQNDACNDGEPWGQAMVSVGADGTATATVNIAPEARCLSTSAPE